MIEAEDELSIAFLLISRTRDVSTLSGLRSSGRKYSRRRASCERLRALNAAEIAGICLILVDAKESAVSFYKHFGFMKLRNLTYFIPVDTVKQALP